MSTRPSLLIRYPLSADALARLAESYDCLYAIDDASLAQALAERADEIRAVLTIGSIGLSAELIAALPALEFVAAFGVGVENIDLAACRARGIAVSNGAGSNAASVADHAMALLLGIVRDLRNLDRLCREGVWRDALAAQDGLTGKRLGLLGFGAIGQAVARRAAAFDMSIGYHARHPRADSPLRYFAEPLALAQWCDCLLIAIPGGPATHHLVDAAMLDALGAHGYLINVARGSVVDSAALADALRGERLAGAALDVYESEPLPPQALIGLNNLLITPHVAARSPQAVQAALEQFLENARRHFAGQALLHPVID